MTGGEFSAEEQRWLATWEPKRQAVADGTMRPEDVYDWAWKKKVLNAINVTIQRIKRSERPGHDPRRYDNTWVTVAAERGQSKDDMSSLATGALAYVVGRLEERGHEFDVDWMARSSGVVVISINIKALREFMRRRAEGKTSET
ncbi:MAG: hypothetical protein R2752_05380 [Vicinamibacterales bacterium]